MDKSPGEKRGGILPESQIWNKDRSVKLIYEDKCTFHSHFFFFGGVAELCAEFKETKNSNFSTIEESTFL